MFNIEDQYLRTFGMNQKAMAASVQSLRYSIKGMNTFSIFDLLDLGSGMSTTVFISYDKNVVSVDDNSEWAIKTELFLH